MSVCFQVEEIVPQVLPRVPAETVTAARLLNALSAAPGLAIEVEGGWLDQQLSQQLRGADSLRQELRYLRGLVEWLALNLLRWGLESQRDRLPVSEMFLFY